jgi:Ulp1 family protease
MNNYDCGIYVIKNARVILTKQETKEIIRNTAKV